MLTQKNNTLEIYNPNLTISNFTTRVSGDSMAPHYINGDIVACKALSKTDFIQWGEVYVLKTNQGYICTRIYQSKRKDMFVCRSEQRHHYPDFEIPVNEVESVNLVVGVVRLV